MDIIAIILIVAALVLGAVAAWTRDVLWAAIGLICLAIAALLPALN